MSQDDLSRHGKIVAEIADEVAVCHRENIQIRIYHGGTNSTRLSDSGSARQIDTSMLNRVISINVEDLFALVEPNVSMDVLVDETMKYDLIPPVVMEFPKITVGGGVQGGAGESSSFKYGLFHEICEDYEMILGNGEIMHASATENPDLYHGTACSYGTLGIITLIKVRLIPAKKYVRLTYHQTKSLKEAIEVVGHEARGGSDFLDGIIFRPDFGVVMTGVFSDKVDLPERTFSKRSDEWFYLHAQKVSSGGASYEEIIPLREYLFRYDQATFWSAKYVFRRFRIPSIKILRTFFNPLLSAKRLYRVLHETGIAQQYIVQDIDVPEAVAASFLDFLDTTVHIYPLWLCPLRTDKHAPLSSTFLNADLVMNIGVWGEAKHDFSDFLKTNRSLETYTTNIGGRKILYAHAYYPEDEFWNVYDKSWYDALRKKYKADKTFPNIYEKVFVSKRYQPAVFKGLMRLLRKKVS